ncbi:MAG: hypothetical protein NTZ84_03640 [Candidatus Nealsonbacteria bacterium]|nr:hypothetical protein [Candidatus Nealsonbacteria bacterium]
MDPEILRKKYPKFVYEKYSYKISGNNLEIFFEFKINPDVVFNPKITIENIEPERIKKIGERGLDNLIFNLGMIESLSYWKATLSKEIIVKAGYLNKEQIKWWKDLIIDGMGQFFYENKIDFRKPNFLNIKSESLKQNKVSILNQSDKILIPVGGGKDSIVTLEVLKRTKKNIGFFSLNPTDAALKIIKISGSKNPIIVRRKIDEKLLEMNRKGFLNGHTPFSAYLAFLAVLLSEIFDYKYVALSNERSSNEGNVKYLGKEINHQWSKSFEFEQRFRNYSKKYLSRGVEYFSFLRPLYEIQIAKLFSKYTKYFPIFLSCNEAHKTDSGKKRPSNKWCGKCSKCLFAFVILYPFVKEKELIDIFGKNLFKEKGLLPIAEELLGEKRFKPFECVGTTKESLAAFYVSWQKAQKADLPFLLNYFEKRILKKYPKLEKESKQILISWDIKNNLPKELKKLFRVEKVCI